MSEKDEMAVCVPSFMDNFPNVLRIIEFVELYKILGATKFFFYNQSVTENVSKVMNYYKRSENVEVFTWRPYGNTI